MFTDMTEDKCATTKFLSDINAHLNALNGPYSTNTLRNTINALDNSYLTWVTA